MGDPRHPAKMVVVLRGGLVSEIYLDKDAPIRVFVADYDDQVAGEDATEEMGYGRDTRGDGRFLREYEPTRDTVEVRAIINKKGGTT